ncbi:MAG: hypothetical protein RR872_04870 [Mucinivorans sp.]
MKSIKQIFGTLLLLSVTAALACSCAKDPLGQADVQPPEGTPVELKVDIQAKSMTQIETRALGDENTIDPTDVKVLVFGPALNPDDKLLLYAPITLQVDDVSNKGFKPITSVGATADERTFLVVANAGAAWNALTLTPNFTKLSDVRLGLISPELRSQPVLGAAEYSFTSTVPKPIFWATLVVKGINWKSALTADGTVYGRPLALARNVGKVSVSLASPTADTKLLGGTLFNVFSSSCAISPGGTLTEGPNNKRVIYSKVSSLDGSTSFCQANGEGSLITPLYGYDTDEASVLIKAKYQGTDYYYRLDLLDMDKVSLPFAPNSHYMVVISKINGRGYRSAIEAMKNDASNSVQYNVEVNGGDDMVSNGSYYLSLECSEYVLCQWEGVTKNINIGKLFYKTPTYINPNNTVKDISMPDNAYVSLVQPANNSNFVYNPVATYTDIIIDLNQQSSAFEDHSATINFALGSLRHALAIRGAKGTMNISNRYERYSLGRDFADINLIGNPAWAFLSSSATYSTSMDLISGQVASPDVDVYLYMAPNNTTTDRRVDFSGVKVSRDATNKRIHVSGHGFQIGYEQIGSFGGAVDLTTASSKMYSKYLAVDQATDNITYRYKNNNLPNDGSITNSITSGFEMTRAVAALASPAEYGAFNVCLNRNRDLNGNGKIDAAEVVWYLPARSQLMALAVFNSGLSANYALATNRKYVSATVTADDQNCFYLVPIPNPGYNLAAGGRSESGAYVRCVKDVDVPIK